MMLKIIGPQPFATDEQGRLRSRVATLFPRHQVLVTLPGIHATQRVEMLARLDADRAEQGLAPLGLDERSVECAQSVDLFLEPGMILIRPDPDHMDLAYEGDELLQELVSKRQIKFLFVMNEKVQQAIKERGECWRMSALPRSRSGMQKLIQEAKVPIDGRPIYYYNRVAGTRYLTCHEFSQLGQLPSAELALHLEEIALHAGQKNRLGNPEVGFFAVAPSFGAADFAGTRFTALPAEGLAARYEALKARFVNAVEPVYRVDDLREEMWRNRMFSTLVSRPEETLTEEVLRGLSPEFFLQVEWLPGGHFEEGEFIFDAVFDEAQQHPEDRALASLCDDTAHGFIYNFIRDYGDLEYVNVGRIASSLSIVRPQQRGRRGVYIAELKLRDARERVVRFIRLQKWGIREHLEEGKGLLESIIESEEYTEYILDRRLGCRQLGMNLPPRVIMRRISERYTGSRTEFSGQFIWATYFERDYLPGIATDKLPTYKYWNENYALRLARLLGKAAACNFIVGRAHEEDSAVIFDDGDEVIVEDTNGLPQELIVGDHSGAFGDFRQPLVFFAKEYARPINSRLDRLPDPRGFAEAYLQAFAESFRHQQDDYRKRRRAFDTLFKHRRYDPNGSFAFRWECVLRRLDGTNLAALVEAIRGHITVATRDLKA